MLVINSREYVNAAIYCVENGVLGYRIMGKLEKNLSDALLLLSDYQPVRAYRPSGESEWNCLIEIVFGCLIDLFACRPAEAGQLSRDGEADC